MAWLPDGTPYSQRFSDRYHSEQPLAQAREVFVHGCNLPGEWAGAAQWRVLETGFGLGLNFLATWDAWRADPNRPRLLHFVSLEAWPVSAADLLRAAERYPELRPLAEQLAAQYWGLLPGVHRLWFEGGRVLLTLAIGDAQALLRQERWEADAIYLDGFSPERNPELWSAHTLKALARCCHRGTRLATWCVAGTVRGALAQCGFQVEKVPGTPPKRHNLRARFDPAWEPRIGRAGVPAAVPTPKRCMVIGAGVAGATSAASLARRGWQVHVLDAADAPASGASGLPVGLFAPHLSPDDNFFSRVSRSGVRAMLQQCEQLLEPGVDWKASGVLERRPPGHLGLPAQWQGGPGDDWSRPAAPNVLHSAGLAPGTLACWHARAGWARPGPLVAALLAQPSIVWQPGASVARLQRSAQSDAGDAPVWTAQDAQGHTLAEAELVVLAAGPACNALLAGVAAAPLPLQSVRGQMSWGLQTASSTGLPPFPVNGQGALVAHVPLADGGLAWHAGSTFERDEEHLPLTAGERAAAHARNAQQLAALLPQAAAVLQADFGPGGTVRAWAGVRCTAQDRLPIVGAVDALNLPGLWVHTAMGARGLTRAVLCGELLAARLHGEPLPLEARLAQALDPRRFAAVQQI